MNADTFKGQWKQIRGKVKEAWGDLTNDEVDQIEGNYDNFVGLLQEKYGRSREKVEEEIDDFFDDLDD